MLRDLLDRGVGHTDLKENCAGRTRAITTARCSRSARPRHTASQRRKRSVDGRQAPQRLVVPELDGGLVDADDAAFGLCSRPPPADTRLPKLKVPVGVT